MARKRMISDADGLADAIAGTVDVDLEQEDDEAEAEHEHDEEGPKVVCVYTYAPWEKSCVAFKESEAFAELEAQVGGCWMVGVLGVVGCGRWVM